MRCPFPSSKVVVEGERRWTVAFNHELGEISEVETSSKTPELPLYYCASYVGDGILVTQAKN
jgi:hypothetical protein